MGDWTGQVALVVAFTAFIALLIHLWLNKQDPDWQRAPHMPLDDEQVQTPRNTDTPSEAKS